MTGPFHLAVRHVGDGRAVLAVTGELGSATASRLREEGSALLADGPVRLLLDMSEVDFCDSSGLSAVIGLWQQALGNSGSLVLVAIPDRLARLMRITGIDTLIPVHHAEDLYRLAPRAPTADPA